MKRVVLAVTGTVAGVTALLSFKTQSHPLAGAAALPSASASTSGATSGAASTTPSTGTSSTARSTTPAAKSYLGPAVTTRYGVVQVEVDVTGAKITSVRFAQLTAFDHHSEQINSQAAPQLLQETLHAQSTQVDTVSGATYTSAGYRESLQSALDRAGIR